MITIISNRRKFILAIKNVEIKKFDPDSLILFLHVPKTGGTTMADILSAVYGKEYLRATPAKLYDLLNTKIHIKDYKAVLGHYSIKDPFYAILDQPINHFMMVREPVDRVISQYYYLRDQEKHPLHDLAMKYTLEEVVTTDLIYELGMANKQTSLITTASYTTKDSLIIAEAKRNLNNLFTLCAIFERYAEFIQICSKEFGWPEIEIPKSNTSSRPALEEISPRIKKAIQEKNLLDSKLYGYALSKYEEFVRQYEHELLPIEDSESDVIIIEGIPVETVEAEEKEAEQKPGIFRRIWRRIFKRREPEEG